jgi:predicted adenylyl cyclase CyaB
MPTNLELKARVRSAQAVRRIAERLGARRAGIQRQVDTYFDGTKGVRLKMRSIAGRGGELICYRRPNRSGARSSEYTRFAVSRPAALTALLRASYGIRAVVRKQREIYRYRNARIHIDRVHGLGTFLEFEVMVTRGRSQAADLMKSLRKWFSIGPQMMVASSYSDLMRIRRKEN